MAQDTRNPQAWETAFGEVVLRFPFLDALVTDIKDAVPFRFRAYDSQTKQWTIDAAYADVAIRLLLRHFPNASVPPRWRFRSPWEEPPTPDRGADDYRVLHLLPTAPVELIETAYRTLARLHHPDRGGDVLAMQRVNAAYASLKSRVSA